MYLTYECQIALYHSEDSCYAGGQETNAREEAAEVETSNTEMQNGPNDVVSHHETDSSLQAGDVLAQDNVAELTVSDKSIEDATGNAASNQIAAREEDVSLSKSFAATNSEESDSASGTLQVDRATPVALPSEEDSAKADEDHSYKVFDAHEAGLIAHQEEGNEAGIIEDDSDKQQVQASISEIT